MKGFEAFEEFELTTRKSEIFAIHSQRLESRESRVSNFWASFEASSWRRRSDKSSAVFPHKRREKVIKLRVFRTSPPVSKVTKWKYQDEKFIERPRDAHYQREIYRKKRK